MVRSGSSFDMTTELALVPGLRTRLDGPGRVLGDTPVGAVVDLGCTRRSDFVNLVSQVRISPGT